MSVPADQKKKIIGIYASVVVVSIIFVSLMMWRSSLIKKRNAEQQQQTNFKINTGRLQALSSIEIPQGEGALEGFVQDGTEVSTNDLKGKVWVVCQFYSKCPHCLGVNFKPLTELYNRFGDDPNFHIVCINLNKDVTEPMKDFADVWKAKAQNWWFLVADVEKVRRWGENKLFHPFQENPGDENEPITHDMHFLVVGPDMHLIDRLSVYDATVRQGVSDEEREADRAAVERQLMDAVESELNTLKK